MVFKSFVSFSLLIVFISCSSSRLTLSYDKNKSSIKTLKTITPNKALTITQIIDDRPNKDGIGMLKTGIVNKPTVAYFNGPLEEEFKRVLENNLQSRGFKVSDNGVPVRIELKKLYLTETPGKVYDEQLHCEAEMLLVAKKDSGPEQTTNVKTELYSKGGVDVTMHADAIMTDCIDSLVNEVVESGGLAKYLN